MAHWSDAYIGRPYIHGEADCGHLCLSVSKEVFGVRLPDDAQVEHVQSRLGRFHQLTDVVEAFMSPAAEPREGDIALLYCRARKSHVGIYCVVDGFPSILHAVEKPGMVVRHRLSDLPKAFLSVEGYYRWN